jgi:hypothetical protein
MDGPGTPNHPILRGNGRWPRDIKKVWPRIVAEGDSWFDFQFGGTLTDPPRIDLLDNLNANHKYAIWRVSKAGDTLANMVSGKEMEKTLKAVKTKGAKIFLFSAGGNDVLGGPLDWHLRKKGSQGGAVKLTELRTHIASLESPFRSMIEKVTDAAPGIRVFLHGYDYAIPSGKTVIKFFDLKIGPWMRPVLEAKGYMDPDEQREIIKVFVNELNEMLGKLAKKTKQCTYIDCRGAVADNQWHDEIHPSFKGFRAVAARFEDAIRPFV